MVFADRPHPAAGTGVGPPYTAQRRMLDKPTSRGIDFRHGRWSKSSEGWTISAELAKQRPWLLTRFAGRLAFS